MYIGAQGGGSNRDGPPQGATRLSPFLQPQVQIGEVDVFLGVERWPATQIVAELVEDRLNKRNPAPQIALHAGGRMLIVEGQGVREEVERVPAGHPPQTLPVGACTQSLVESSARFEDFAPRPPGSKRDPVGLQ